MEEYLLYPQSFIEDKPGKSIEESWEARDKINEFSKELRNRVLTWEMAVFGACFFVFLFFFTYHVISKIRGNERNTKMNNQAIFLCSLGLVENAINFV